MKTSTKYYFGSSIFIGLGCMTLADNWWKASIAMIAFVIANSFESFGNWNFYSVEK